MNSPPPRNPRRVAAGRANRLKRLGITPDGAERLRAAALAGRPWQCSTGPKTAAGKEQSAANGKLNASQPGSIRSARNGLAELRQLMIEMQAARRALPPSPEPVDPLGE